MAKSMVLNALTKVFGEYVTGLNRENLKIAVFSGKVELRDVALNPKAIARHQLPLEICAGSLSKLKVWVPWASLETKPVKVEISDVFLLVRPTDREQVDPVELHKNMVRLRRLQIEDALRSRLETRKQADEADDDSYVARVQRAILENMEIRIVNVHIRYEDTECLSIFASEKILVRPQQTLAVGLTIQEVLLQRVNERWEPISQAQAKPKGKATQEADMALRKRGTISAMALYFDLEAPALSSLPLAQVKKAMAAMIARGGDLGPPRSKASDGAQRGHLSYNALAKRLLAAPSHSWETIRATAPSYRDSKLHSLDQRSEDAESLEMEGSSKLNALPANLSGPPTLEAYILEPSFAEVSYTHNYGATASHEDTATYEMRINLFELSTRISGSQFEGYIALQSQLERLHTFYRNFSYRPRQRPDKDPRGWWRYAYRCVTGSSTPTMSYILSQKKQYVSLYLRTLGLSFVPELDEEEEEQLAHLDLRLPLQAIVSYRILTLTEKAALEKMKAARDEERGESKAKNQAAADEDALLMRLNPLEAKSQTMRTGAGEFFRIRVSASVNATLADCNEEKLLHALTNVAAGCSLSHSNRISADVVVSYLSVMDLVSSDALLGTLVRSSPSRSLEQIDVLTCRLSGLITPLSFAEIRAEAILNGLDVVVNYPCVIGILQSFQMRDTLLSQVKSAVRSGVEKARNAANESLAKVRPMNAALQKMKRNDSISVRGEVRNLRLSLPITADASMGFCLVQLDLVSCKSMIVLDDDEEEGGKVLGLVRVRGLQLSAPPLHEAQEALAKPWDPVLTGSSILEPLNASVGVELSVSCNIGCITDEMKLRLCADDIRRLHTLVLSLGSLVPSNEGSQEPLAGQVPMLSASPSSLADSDRIEEDGTSALAALRNFSRRRSSHWMEKTPEMSPNSPGKSPRSSIPSFLKLDRHTVLDPLSRAEPPPGVELFQLTFLCAKVALNVAEREICPPRMTVQQASLQESYTDLLALNADSVGVSVGVRSESVDVRVRVQSLALDSLSHEEGRPEITKTSPILFAADDEDEEEDGAHEAGSSGKKRPPAIARSWAQTFDKRVLSGIARDEASRTGRSFKGSALNLKPIEERVKTCVASLDGQGDKAMLQYCGIRVASLDPLFALLSESPLATVNVKVVFEDELSLETEKTVDVLVAPLQVNLAPAELVQLQSTIASLVEVFAEPWRDFVPDPRRVFRDSVNVSVRRIRIVLQDTSGEISSCFRQKALEDDDADVAQLEVLGSGLECTMFFTQKSGDIKVKGGDLQILDSRLRSAANGLPFPVVCFPQRGQDQSAFYVGVYMEQEKGLELDLSLLPVQSFVVLPCVGEYAALVLELIDTIDVIVGAIVMKFIDDQDLSAHPSPASGGAESAPTAKDGLQSGRELLVLPDDKRGISSQPDAAGSALQIAGEVQGLDLIVSESNAEDAEGFRFRFGVRLHVLNSQASKKYSVAVEDLSVYTGRHLFHDPEYDSSHRPYVVHPFSCIANMALATTDRRVESLNVTIAAKALSLRLGYVDIILFSSFYHLGFEQLQAVFQIRSKRQQDSALASARELLGAVTGEKLESEAFDTASLSSQATSNDRSVDTASSSSAVAFYDISESRITAAVDCERLSLLLLNDVEEQTTPVFRFLVDDLGGMGSSEEKKSLGTEDSLSFFLRATASADFWDVRRSRWENVLDPIGAGLGVSFLFVPEGDTIFGLDLGLSFQLHFVADDALRLRLSTDQLVAIGDLHSLVISRLNQPAIKRESNGGATEEKVAMVVNETGSAATLLVQRRRDGREVLVHHFHVASAQAASSATTGGPLDIMLEHLAEEDGASPVRQREREEDTIQKRISAKRLLQQCEVSLCMGVGKVEPGSRGALPRLKGPTNASRVYTALGFEKDGASVGASGGPGQVDRATAAAEESTTLFEVEAFENQRYNVIRKRWQTPYLPGDPSLWCNSDLKPRDAPGDTRLPSGAACVEQWSVRPHLGGIQGVHFDSKGWTYGPDFRSLAQASGVAAHRVQRDTDLVRQRRWTCRYRADSSGQVVPLVWEVEHSKGGRTIARIRSPCTVVNMCKVPLEFESIAIPDRQVPGGSKLFYVEPGQRGCIPVDCALRGGVRLRPRVPASGEYGWTSPVAVLPSAADVEQSYQLSSAGVTSGLRSFSVRASVRARRNLVELTVGPVAVVHNLLPCPLVFMSCAAETTGQTVVAKVGPSCALDLHHDEDFMFCMQLQGHDQSEYISVSSHVDPDLRMHPITWSSRESESNGEGMRAGNAGRSSPSVVRVSLRNEDEAGAVPLSLLCRCERSLGKRRDESLRGTIGIRVWSALWVVNWSNTHLMLGQEVKSSRTPSTLCEVSLPKKVYIDDEDVLVEELRAGYEAHMSSAQLAQGKVMGMREFVSDKAEVLKDCGVHGVGLSMASPDQLESTKLAIGLRTPSSTRWSTVFDVETLGQFPLEVSVGEHEQPRSGNAYIHLVGSISTAPGIFGSCRTRILALSPRTAVVNCCSAELDMGQAGASSSGDPSNVLTLPGMSQKGILVALSDASGSVSGGILAHFRLPGTDWSLEPINLSQFGSFSLHLPGAKRKAKSLVGEASAVHLTDAPTPPTRGSNASDEGVALPSLPAAVRDSVQMDTGVHDGEAVIHVEVTTPGLGVAAGIGPGSIPNLGRAETLVIVWCNVGPSSIVQYPPSLRVPPPLYTIVNHTDKMISFRQKSDRPSEASRRGENGRKGKFPFWNVLPCSGKVFGWSAPTRSHALEAVSLAGTFVDLPSFEIVGQEHLIDLGGTFAGKKSVFGVYARVVMEANSKVLHLWSAAGAKGSRAGAGVPRKVTSAMDSLFRGHRHQKLLEGRSPHHRGGRRANPSERSARRKVDSGVALSVPGISMSFIATTKESKSRVERRREVLRLHVRDVYARTLATNREFKLKIGDIQIDNFMKYAVFPVALGRSRSLPAYLRPSGRGEGRKISDASALQQMHEEQDTDTDADTNAKALVESAPVLELDTFFMQPSGGQAKSTEEGGDSGGPAGRVLSLRLLPLEIQLDYYSSVRLVEMIEPFISSYSLSQTKAIHAPQRWLLETLSVVRGTIKSPSTAGLDVQRVLRSAQRPRIYFLSIWMHPIQINASFIATRVTEDAEVADAEEAAGPQGQGTDGVSEGFLGGIGRSAVDFASSLATVHRAPIRFTTFATEHATISGDSLQHILRTFYLRQLLPQLVLVAGSLSVLGNPVELCSSIGTGVRDLFYEPVQGLMVSPAEAAKGVVRGTSSLIRGVVTGAFGTVTGIGDGVSRNLALLSIDREFTSQREATRNAQVASRGGVMTGIGKGIGFGIGGVVGGVSGIITQPIRGARQEGVGGFVKGVGRGLVGAVVKPVVGVTDAAVSVMSGISNQVDKLTNLQHLEPRMALAWDPMSRSFEMGGHSMVNDVAQLLLETGKLVDEERKGATMDISNMKQTVQRMIFSELEEEKEEVFQKLLAVGESAVLVSSERVFFFSMSGLLEAERTLRAKAAQSGFSQMFRRLDVSQKCSQIALRHINLVAAAQPTPVEDRLTRSQTTSTMCLHIVYEESKKTILEGPERDVRLAEAYFRALLNS